MSTPSALKRRRPNDDLKALQKAFVSPLRSRVPRRTSSNKKRDNAAGTPYLPSTLAHSTPAASTPTVSRSASRTSCGVYTPTKSTPIRKAHLGSGSSLRRKVDPAEADLLSSLTKLEMQIRTMQNDIDTLKQCASLQSSSTDADREDLSVKWQHVSQSAAEELFGSVKERVNRMGGVAAWRESEKRKFDRSNGLGEFAEEPAQDDDADCEFDSQGEELPEAEQAWRKKQKQKAREEARDAMDVLSSETGEEPESSKTKVWQGGGSEDDSFTMDMMLRSLNIELDVIGFDKGGQRWIT